jgi:hypothetical protein
MIVNQVSGRMLAGAMIRAQAAKDDNRIVCKQRAGVGFLTKHLADNSVRQEAWRKLTRFSPPVLLARASLNTQALDKAGEVIEGITEPGQREWLLCQVIAPHFKVKLFDEEISSKPKALKALAGIDLAPLLALSMPKPELALIPDQSGKLIGQQLVTISQYATYAQQVGLYRPQYARTYADDWRSMVSVNYNEATAFARWQERRLPTLPEIKRAQQAPPQTLLTNRESLSAQEYLEWTTTPAAGEERVTYQLGYKIERPMGQAYAHSSLGFRVIED